MLREREREREGEIEGERGRGRTHKKCACARRASREPWPLLQLSSEPSMNAPLFSLQCNHLPAEKLSVCTGLGTRGKTPS